MKLIPAIDLSNGQCVQLRGGSFDQELYRADDPVLVAKLWNERGFNRLHVVDLDRATGRGSNIDIALAIVKQFDGQVQVGGGIRDESQIETLLDAGAYSAIVGTKAISDRSWLETISQRWPQTITVAADIRDETFLAVNGWENNSDVMAEEFLVAISQLPVLQVLTTSIADEGNLEGTDVELFNRVVKASAKPVVAAGGITTYSDIEQLKQVGVSAVVVGTALYVGPMDDATPDSLDAFMREGDK